MLQEPKTFTFEELPLGLQVKVVALRDKTSYIPLASETYFKSLADLERFNLNVNMAFVYTPDKGDVWKVPDEFVNDNGGDCEDFAIFKYHLIKKARPDLKPRVAVVQDKNTLGFHAVLIVNFPGSITQEIVLDSLASSWPVTLSDYQSFNRLLYITDGDTVTIYDRPQENLGLDMLALNTLLKSTAH